MMNRIMEELHFVQSHPSHTFSEEDKMDYTEQDKYFIQCLKTIENIMDIDAFINDKKKALKTENNTMAGNTIHTSYYR